MTEFTSKHARACGVVLQNLSSLRRGTARSQLAKNVVSGPAASLFGLVTMAVTYPLYLHYLGYERYGLWLVLNTVISFAQLCSFGIGPAVAKLVAEERARQRYDAIGKYVGTALMTVAVSGGAALLTILLFRRQFPHWLGLSGLNAEVAASVLPWVGVLTLYVLLVDILNSTLAGLGRIDLTNYIQVCAQALGAICAIGLLRLHFQLGSLIAGTALTYFVIHVLSTAYIVKEGQVRAREIFTWDAIRFRRLIRFGSGVAGGSFINFLLTPINRLVLTRFAGLAAVPIYDLAYSGSMKLRGILESGVRAIMPEISRLGANTGPDASARIQHVIRRVAVLILLVGTSVFVGAMLLASPVSKIWLGSRYSPEIPPALRIALVGAFLSLLATPPFHTIMGLGRTGHVFASFAIQSGTNAAVIAIALAFWHRIDVNTVLFGAALGAGTSMIYLWMRAKDILRNLSPEPGPHPKPISCESAATGQVLGGIRALRPQPTPESTHI
jgi:O-antigen/teichoic acid export membrane protein